MSYANFHALAQTAGAGMPDGNNSFSIKHGRHSIVASYRQAKKTSTLTLECRLPALPVVYVRKESAVDRLGKRIGLNRELQTGDSVFDQNVYTESNAKDEAVLKLLGHERVRAATLLLLQLGFNQVEFGKSGVKLEVSGNDGAAVFEPSRYKEAAGALEIIAAHLPEFSGQEAQSPYWTMGVMVTTACIAALVLICIFSIAVSETYRPLDWGPWLVGWAIGAGAWLIWFPICGRLVRGRSNSMRHFIISMILMVFALPIAGGAFTVFFNAAWDTSPKATHPTRVVRQWTTRSKNSTTYHTEVAGWRDTVPVEFKGSAFYNSRHVGAPVIVVTRAGAFGWEWIESYT